MAEAAANAFAQKPGVGKCNHMFPVKISPVYLMVCALPLSLVSCAKPYTPGTEARVAKGGVMATIPLDDVKDGRPPTVTEPKPIDPKAEPDHALQGYRPGP
jgi:hypothetical protein